MRRSGGGSGGVGWVSNGNALSKATSRSTPQTTATAHTMQRPKKNAIQAMSICARQFHLRRRGGSCRNIGARVANKEYPPNARCTGKQVLGGLVDGAAVGDSSRFLVAATLACRKGCPSSVRRALEGPHPTWFKGGPVLEGSSFCSSRRR
jgi:hypothetical protein